VRYRGAVMRSGLQEPLRNRLPCKEVVHGIRGRKGSFPVSEGVH